MVVCKRCLEKKTFSLFFGGESFKKWSFVCCLMLNVFLGCCLVSEEESNLPDLSVVSGRALRRRGEFQVWVWGDDA